MRAASLDRRVRKEAAALVRQAKTALAVKPNLRGKAGDLAAVTDDVSRGLAANDGARIRAGLPALDALVDELLKRPTKSTTRDYVESIGAAVLIALALRAFIVEAFKIPSASMYPTLEINDHIFVNKFIFGMRIPWTNTKLFDLRAPARGDVIVFMMPCDPDRDYIKRVIGLPGDTIEVRCNTVFVNGKPNVQKLLDGTRCEYEDQYPEGSTVWTPRTCSRWEETNIDGKTYQTFQDPSYPALDKAHLVALPLEVSRTDFPKVAMGEATLKTCHSVAGADEMRDAPNQKPGQLVQTAPAQSRIGMPTAAPCALQEHYVVPDGHVFVMGDNRPDSNDSRFWGSVPIENIKGTALFMWLSYRTLPWEMRWDRIGEIVH